MASPPPEPLSLRKVLSESGRIIRLHQCHFEALSVLFLYPLSLFSFLYLIIVQNQKQDNLLQPQEISSKLLQAFSSNGFLMNFNQTPYQYLLLSLLYTLVSNLFFLAAAASISHSTYLVSHGEPVDLISSLKSILHSFWPLVSTSLVTGLIGILIATPFVISVFLVSVWLHQSSLFLPCVILICLIFGLGLMYLRVNWILAYVVVMVESKWGYEPLKRSAYLVKGNRKVALQMVLYFESITGLAYWSFNRSWMGGGQWFSLALLLLISFCVNQLLLLSCVATAVLYIYCRESNQGLPSLNPEKLPLLLGK